MSCVAANSASEIKLHAVLRILQRHMGQITPIPAADFLQTRLRLQSPKLVIHSSGDGVRFSASECCGYSAAMDEHRPAVRQICGQVFETHGLDAIVYPTTPLPARPIGDDETATPNGEQVPTFPTYILNTGLGSKVGAPGISLPWIAPSGLPVGIEFGALPGKG